VGGLDSMEPAFQRGDLLFLWNRNLDINQYAGPPMPKGAEFGGTQVGEIVVYNVVGKDIPIVHRVVRRHKGVYVIPSPTGPSFPR
jgi:signal peptidase